MRRAASILALALLVALAAPTVSLAEGTGNAAPSATGSAVTKQHPKTHALKLKRKAKATKRATTHKAKTKAAKPEAKTSKHEHGQHGQTK